MKKIFQKAIVLPLIVVIVLAIVIFKVKSKPPIEHTEMQYPAVTVEVITVKNLPFRSRTTAYGNVEPSVVLKAKTEVSGKISYIHPQLKKGESLAAGTVVLRIEPTTFEFSLGQSQADLTANQSSLKQLQVEETSARKSLSIAKKNLATGKKELARITSVWEKKLISRSAVDAEEQKVLQLQQTVEDLQGKLNSFASRKAANQAQITKSETVLEQSKDTLGRTEVVLPFDARVGTVDIENGEFVTVGATLFEALGTQSVEINAQLPVKHFRPLLLGLGKDAVNLQGSKLLQRQVDQFKISAHINLVGFNNEHANWKGKLIRIGESIDPDRDTIGLVVKVDNPYQNVIPGIRPPLLKGMYAAVEFFTPAHKMLVIPRKALHQGRVYVALDNNQLEIRPVTVLYKQGEMVVIKSGIKEGEKIIITDVTPVINGLPLNLVFAADAEQALATSALGGEL